MNKKFKLLALSLISLGLASCGGESLVEEAASGTFGDVPTAGNTGTSGGKTNVGGITNEQGEPEPEKQPEQESETEQESEPEISPELKQRLFENNTRLNSKGKGYTYLNFDLQEKFKAWENLVSDGDITVSNGSVTDEKLDRLGKGVLDLEDGVKLAEGALNNNEFIDTLIVPDGEKMVGPQNSSKGIAQNAKSLRKVVLPDTITLICTSAFQNCTSLVDINFPSSINKLGANSFQGTKITSADLSNTSIKSIDSKTFNGCKELASVVLPDTVTQIGINAFENCEKLGSINLSNNITVLRSEAFKNCKSLQNITIPNNLGVIQSSGDNNVVGLDYGIFYGCESLTEITIPSSIARIRQQCFTNCTSLRKVNFEITGTGKIDITEGPVFDGCSSLESIDLSKLNYRNKSDVDSASASVRSSFSGTGIKSVSFPYRVINEKTFENSGLESITFTQAGTIIKNNAFKNSKKLSSINLSTGASISKIEYECFSGCESLATVDLTVESIKPGAVGKIFENCSSLTTASLKTTAAATSNNRFYLVDAFKGCAKLTQVTIDSVSFSTNGSGHLSIASWDADIRIRQSGDEKSPIFTNCSNLEKVYIKNMVLKEGDMIAYPRFYGAFEGCSKLNYVEFPGTVEQWILATYGYETQDSETSFKQNTQLKVKCLGGYDNNNTSVVTLSKDNYKTYLSNLSTKWNTTVLADL